MNLKDWSPLKLIVVGSLILGTILLAFIAGLAALVFSLVKSNDAYRLSLRRIQEDPAAIEMLGEPIEPGYLVLGSINTTGKTRTKPASGEADLSYRVSGPIGEATVTVKAHKEEGVWCFEQISIHNTDSTKQIELVTEALPDRESEE